MITIERLTLPDFGSSAELPPLSAREYDGRLRTAVARMQRDGLDLLVVYADREHMANMAYLTGFDPRFEEALLLLDAAGRRLLVVGNECMGYLPDPQIGYEVALFQEFSLPGQPRGKSRPLRRILSDWGIGRGRRIGCVGWKTYRADLTGDPAHTLDAPSYLVDLLRELAGDPGLVRNATELFIGLQDGLRVINSATQLAQFEYAATRTSGGVLAALRHVQVGQPEHALEVYLQGDGLPLATHRNIAFGEGVRRGLASPTANRSHLGDAVAVGYGLWGSLTCRAGAVAHGPEELPAETRDLYPRLVANYFAVVAAWYERLALGVSAGEVYAAVEACRDPQLYDFAVNPGHYIHLDEWVNSPFAPDSPIALRSGMALQADIIPVSRGPLCYSNAEDTLALADAALRAELTQRYPDCWRRIQARRAFMSDTLGIRLDESVLPLGNIPGWLPPYALDLEQVLVKR